MTCASFLPVPSVALTRTASILLFALFLCSGATTSRASFLGVKFPWTNRKRGAVMSSSSSSSVEANVGNSAKKDAEAYNAIVSSSVDLSNAHASNGLLTVTRSVRDIDCNKRRKYVYSIPLQATTGNDEGEDGPPIISIPPTELADAIKARIVSPSGDKVVMLREEHVGKKGETRQVIEIWTHNCQSLSRRIVLPDKVHGKVVNDPGWFGSISWNQQETTLVYSAERKSPETASFFRTNQNDDDETAVNVGSEHTLGLGKTETWGEKYTHMAPLLDLYCLHIGTGNIGRVENVPGTTQSNNDNTNTGTRTRSTTTNGGFVLGQAVFDPTSKQIVYTGWDAGGGGEMPRRLGMIYCFQRPCKIYASSINKLVRQLEQETNDPADDTKTGKDDAFICLTPNAKLSRSPVFGPTVSDISKLAFLSSEAGHDTHWSAISLCTIDWNTRTVGGPELTTHRELVKVVEKPSEEGVKVADMGFPGLYLNQLPSPCFAPDAKSILTTTQWGSLQRIIRISVTDGSITLLDICSELESGVPARDSHGSQSLLCIAQDGGLVVSKSSPNEPHTICYVAPGELSAEESSQKIQARVISKMPHMVASSFSSLANEGLSRAMDFTSEVLSIPAPKVPGAVDTSIQCIFLLPNNVVNPPLIVIPHGGPHSCSATTFIPSYAFLCTHGGYAILHVNYRGSTGFGEGPLNSLPGNCGVVDVKDVVEATMQVAKSGFVDANRIGICGGSHGGFLAAHCSGQYPDLFKAAVMRNPVTNIASMVTSTDIPDWCYVETFGNGKYDWSQYCSPTKEDLDAMWQASPVAHVQNVVSPTLVLLGMSDQRVPPSQGLEYFYTLRSKGVKTNLIMYEKDDHAIDIVASEADFWINTKRWFHEHL